MKKKLLILTVVVLLSVVGFVGASLVLEPACVTNFEQRYMFSQHLTSEQKAAYWQAHLQNVLNTWTLTSGQENAIKMAQDLAVESAYDTLIDSATILSATDPYFILHTEIQANFTKAEQAEIFELLPEYSHPAPSQTDIANMTDPERPSPCTCSTWMSTCGWFPNTNGYGCNSTVFTCSSWGTAPGGGGACGYMWMMRCNGHCILWGNDM